MDHLALPNVYRHADGLVHTSSDGQKLAPQEGRCDETPQKAFYRSIIALFVFGTGTLVPKCPVTPTFQPSKEGNNAGAQRSGKFLQCPFETIDVSPMRVRLCRYKR
jgi:hypothetical protein